MEATLLKEALRDPFFAKVENVGLNGGEPSLYPEIEKLLDALFVLPHLQSIYIISNGMCAEPLKKMIYIIKEKCSQRKIKVHLSLSIDAVGKTHDQIRGVSTAFEKTMATLKELNANPQLYCDELTVGCTLSRENIARVVEVECLMEKLNIPSYCHLAVPNRRLYNFDSSDFSILNDRRSLLMAAAYFFGRFKYEKSLRKRIIAFCTYYYLRQNGHDRIAGCNYLRSDVTITERMELYLCATASECIGNLREHTASELIASEKLKAVERNTKRYCDTCTHYVSFPTFRGLLFFIVEKLKSAVWVSYKIRAEFMQCFK